MEIIDEKSQIQGIAIAWLNQYANDFEVMKDKKVIYDRLLALDTETATAQDVAEIIGNSSWTGPTRCNECGGKFSEVVEVGEEWDHDSETAKLCRGCAEKAVLLFKTQSDNS